MKTNLKVGNLVKVAGVGIGMINLIKGEFVKVSFTFPHSLEGTQDWFYLTDCTLVY